MSDIERLPPHSIEAEEAVLGSLLIDPDAIFEVGTFLKSESFYRVACCHNRCGLRIEYSAAQLDSRRG